MKLASLFKPLLQPKSAFGFLVASVVVAAATTWAEFSLSTRLAVNSTSALLLSLELKHESAPNRSLAREKQAELIRINLARMQSPQISFYSFFHPEFSANRRLGPALSILLDRGSTVTDDDALRQAQEILEKTGRDWAAPTGTVVSLWTAQSHDRVRVANEILQTFYSSSARYISSEGKAPDSADQACMDSRFATSMVLSAWPDLTPAARIRLARRLDQELAALSDAMNRFALTAPDPEAAQVKRYANNVKSRREFLAKLDNGGVQAGRNLLLASLAMPASN